MSRRFISLVVASHLAAVLAGVWCARPSGGESLPVDQPVAEPSKRPVRSLAPVNTPAAAFQSTKEWSEREFAGAWKALGQTRLSKSERAKIRKKLLVNWAERDLASAIEAALGEEWNDEPNQDVLKVTLFDVFYVPFMEDPQGTWDMISTGRFGIDTGLLRSLWIQTAREKDPLFLVSRIGVLPVESRQEALNACSADIFDEETREAAVQILSKLPRGVLNPTQLAQFAAPRPKE